jgi:hypothetical protein
MRELRRVVRESRTFKLEGADLRSRRRRSMLAARVPVNLMSFAGRRHYRGVHVTPR